ncbi:hypothetical protein BDR03DRAFT_1018820 [Suillus americanus]|nr:hypothetical protein BDR03DRAFT_1018820 [Suillus americanus]
MYILHSIPDDDLHVPVSSVILTDALNVALSVSSVISDTLAFCKDLVPPILSHQYYGCQYRLRLQHLDNAPSDSQISITELQAHAFFAQSCKQADVPVLELMQWIWTQWASMHSFITWMLLLQKGVNLFVELVDDSEDVPSLKGKCYADFCLNKNDWEKLKLVHEVLQEPASATQTFSSSRDPSVWWTIPILEFLQKSWENMAALPRFSPVHDAIHKGLNNVAKWNEVLLITDYEKWTREVRIGDGFSGEGAQRFPAPGKRT